MGDVLREKVADREQAALSCAHSRRWQCTLHVPR